MKKNHYMIFMLVMFFAQIMLRVAAGDAIQSNVIILDVDEGVLFASEIQHDLNKYSIDNSATWHGPLEIRTDCTVKNGTIRNNSLTGDALVTITGGNVVFEDVTFDCSNCTPEALVRIAFGSKANVTFKGNCRFLTSSKSVDAIYVDYGVKGSVRFDKSFSGYVGGRITLAHEPTHPTDEPAVAITIDGSGIFECNAALDGGGASFVNSSVVLEGGRFAVAPDEDLVPDGFYIDSDEDGYWQIKKEIYTVGATLILANTNTTEVVWSGEAINECNLDFLIPARDRLPNGTRLLIKKITFASLNNSFVDWDTTNNKSDPYAIRLNGVNSDKYEFGGKIASNSTTSDNAISYTFSDPCEVLVGQKYCAVEGNEIGEVGDGIAFLYSNGKLVYSTTVNEGAADRSSVRYVKTNDSESIMSTSTAEGITGVEGYYPVYVVEAEIVHIPVVARIALDANDESGDIGEMEAEVGTEIGALPLLTRDGYEFFGWFTAETGGDMVTDTWIVDGTRTLYAHWAPIVTWSNTGAYTRYYDGALSESNFDFKIPYSRTLPEGSIVRIRKITFASVNTSFVGDVSSAGNSDAYYVRLNGVDSEMVNGGTAELSEDNTIASASSLTDRALVYVFSNNCDIVVGKRYPASLGNDPGATGNGISLLWSNKSLIYSTISGVGADRAAVRYVTFGGASSLIQTDTSLRTTSVLSYPVYSVEAVVVSIAEDAPVETPSKCLLNGYLTQEEQLAFKGRTLNEMLDAQKLRVKMGGYFMRESGDATLCCQRAVRDADGKLVSVTYLAQKLDDGFVKSVTLEFTEGGGRIWASVHSPKYSQDVSAFGTDFDGLSQQLATSDSGPGYGLYDLQLTSNDDDTVTASAVWDGNFKATEMKKYTGYELVDWQETHGEDLSSVTIDRDNQGLMFESEDGMDGVTIIVRYVGLAAGSTCSRVLFTSCVTSAHKYDRTGIQLLPNGKLLGIWNNSTAASDDADYGSASGSIAESGIMVFTYDATSGTALYYGASCNEIDATPIWGNTGLKSKYDISIYGAGIGGMYHDATKSGTEAAKGMTIDALAIFDHVISIDEMKAFKWPNTSNGEDDNQHFEVSDKGTVTSSDNGVYVVVAKEGQSLTSSDFIFAVPAARDAYTITIADGGAAATVALNEPVIDVADEETEKDTEDPSGVLVNVALEQIDATPTPEADESIGALSVKTYPGLYYQASWGSDLSNMRQGEKVQATGDTLYLGVIKQQATQGFYKVTVSEQ